MCTPKPSVAVLREAREGWPSYVLQQVSIEILSIALVIDLLVRMRAGDKRAIEIFRNDFKNTYKHLSERVEATASGQEQIQLFAEDPSSTINFNVPEGPPPKDLVLEGPGTEDLDIEEVRKALQMRWDVFDGFPQDMKDALRTNKLEEVNKVLGAMDVPTAEGVVQNLNIAGILSFSDGNIRDQTGQENA